MMRWDERISKTLLGVINRPRTVGGEIIRRGGGGGEGGTQAAPVRLLVCVYRNLEQRQTQPECKKKKRMWERRKTAGKKRTATKREMVRKWALKLLQSSAQTPQKHFQAWVGFFTYVYTNTNSKELMSVMFQNPPWIPHPSSSLPESLVHILSPSYLDVLFLSCP